jgi:protein-tyrosine kinase
MATGPDMLQDTLKSPNPGSSTRAAEAVAPRHEERPIGDLLVQLRNLGAEQIERILAHQRNHGLRFGEAAVALGLASNDDVLFALSQQFDYPYATKDDRSLGAELVALHDPFGVAAEHFRSLPSA